MALEDSVNNLVDQTTQLLQAINVSKQTLDNTKAASEVAAEAAGISKNAAESARDNALLYASQAETFKQAAEAARDDAVAVVYSGDASLEPAAGKIPVARADGTIDPGWLPDQLMMRPNRIDEDVIIPDGYNAFFIDPVEFGPNVTVTGLGNSTLRGV